MTLHPKNGRETEPYIDAELKPWHSKTRYRLLLLIIALVISTPYTHRLYRELTMPPTLVYLIPETFVGAVFVFFDQKSGIVPVPDPLGQAVHVPENGVVLLSGSVHDLVRSARYGLRPEAMVSVKPDGSRRVLTMFRGTYRGDDGELVEGYIDANDQLHEHPVPPNPKADLPRADRNFYYFSPEQLQEKMVFSRDGCRHQGFVAQPEKIRSGEADMNKAGVPGCGKFLVASPQQFLEMPNWLWRGPSAKSYESVDEFIRDSNDRVLKKRALYGAPVTGTR